MAKQTKKAPTTKERKDVYAEVTNSIVAALESGTRPWHKPWQTEQHVAGPIGRPLRHNGELYRGVNVILLWVAAIEKGYNAPIWMTYKQAEELGAHVRKDEKGTQIVFASTFTPDGEDEEKKISFMKGYTVFNADQIEGLPEKFTQTLPGFRNEDARNLNAESFFSNLGSRVEISGSRALYSPHSDTVRMPDFATFRDANSYYATMAHEHIHWTGHKSRLERDPQNRFGNEGYAMEELVAELGAAFICADLEITPQIEDNHAPYIANWIRVLKNDKRAIFTAASRAQSAADYLHKLQPTALDAAA